MHRSSILFLTLAGFVVAACDEPPEPQPPEPPQPQPESTAPIVRPGHHIESTATTHDPVAARRRLDAAKKKIKRQSPEAFLESAKAAEAEQHYKEARDAHRGLFLHYPLHPQSPAALELATRASVRLGRHLEAIEFFEDGIELVRGRVAEARLLRLLGNTYLTLPHYGTEKGGELHRGRYDQGRFRYTYDDDRQNAVRHLEASRALYISMTSSAAAHADELGVSVAKASRVLADERVETQFDLVQALTKFTPYDANWYYWYWAWDDVADDREDEHGVDEHAGRWGRYDLLYRTQPRGMPVDESGAVIFTSRPSSYETSLDTTSKLKFLLHDLSAVDSAEVHARAKFSRAMVFEARHGAARLRRLSSWWWMGSTPFKATIDETPLYELDDDQRFGLIATHVGRYRVPRDESTLALLDEIIETYSKTNVVHDAFIARAAFFQSRQQYARAIGAYQQYLEAHPKGRRAGDARHQIDQLRAPAAVFGQTGVQAAGAKARVDIEHRNVDKLYARAHRMDVEKAVRAFESKIESDEHPNFNPNNLAYRFWREADLSAVAIGAPVDFELSVERDGTHRFRKTTLDLPLDREGLWVVTLFADEARERRLSRGVTQLASLALVEKGDTKSPFIWVVDAKSGQPVKGANVRTFDYRSHYKANKNYYEHRFTNSVTDADGIARLKRRNGQRVVTVRSGGRFAIAAEGFWWGYSPTRFTDADVALVFTDRPVYRPKHRVELRSWVRRRLAGVYAPGASVKKLWVRVNDAKGGQVFEGQAAPDATGGFTLGFDLAKDAPLGLYRVTVLADGRHVPARGAEFRVEEYKAPEFEVNVDVDGNTKLGAIVPVEIRATYLFGGGVADAKVTYKILRSDYDHRWVAPGPWDWLYGAGYGRCYYAYPWLEWWGDWGPRPWHWYPWWGPEPKPRRELVMEGAGRLDEDGVLRVEIDTRRAKALYGESDQRFAVEVEVTDATRRTIVGTGEVIATRHSFFVSTQTDRGYLHAGETAVLRANVLEFGGAPLAEVDGRFEVAAIRYRGTNGAQVTESPVFSARARTDQQGVAQARWDAEAPGQYRLSFVTKDETGARVVGSSILWVWGASMDTAQLRFNHLEVISDKRTYTVGDTAKLLINADVENAKVLFSSFVDGGVMEAPRVIALNAKSTVVEIVITEKHVPNFFVEAVVVGDGKLSEEVRELFVPPTASVLNVALTPSASTYEAGGKGRLDILTTTPDGKPIAANVAVSVFDRAVLYIQPELTPDVRKVFWGEKRRHRVAAASNLKKRLGPFEHAARPDDMAQHLLARAQFADGLAARGSGAGGGGYGRGSMAKADSSTLELDESEDRRAGGKRDADRREEAKPNKAAEAPPPPPTPPGAAASTPRVRKNFVDTAAWRVVHTNVQGRASIDWTFPDNLTTWRIKAIGVSPTMRVGQASTAVVTTKKLLVQLQAPRFFRERDRVAITAVVHNRLERARQVKVALDVTAALLEREGEATRTLEVLAGGKQRVDFWVNVRGEGEAKVRITATTADDGAPFGDAKELTFPVLVHGFTKTDAATGSIPFGEGVAEASVTIEIPEARRVESTELVVRTAPSLAMTMVDALPYLLEYPYGCTEQTMSRFVPAAVTKKALQQAGGLDLSALEAAGKRLHPRFDRNPVYDDAEMNRIVRAGLKRITKLRNPDGGWGWWGLDSSSPYTTAYVLYGLAEAIDADVEVDPDLVRTGTARLRAFVRADLRRYESKAWISDTDAFSAYVLSRFDGAPKPLLDVLYERRARLSVYGKSLLAMALFTSGRKDDARVALRNAAQFLETDDENGTAWLETSQSGWWYWYNSNVESNATFLRALVTIRPNDARAPRLIKWLLQNRKNGWYWRSTRDTAVVISSFGAYLRARRVQDTNYDLDILVDGVLNKSVHIDRTNLLTFDGELRLKGDALTAGRHRITFRRRGKGAVFFNTSLSYFTLEEDASASGLEVKVERRYFKLVRDDREHTAHDDDGRPRTMREVAYRKVPVATGDRVNSGDLLLVQLQIESKNDYTFLAFEDPKPAGAEPVALRSGTTYGEAVANMELRDDRVVFFLRHLAQGKLHLEYRLRAEIPGMFHTMPTRGFAMYAPEIRATSSEIRIGVDDPN